MSRLRKLRRLIQEKRGKVVLVPEESAIIQDAVADRLWFEANPGVDERRRLASTMERKLTGLPPGTEVIVMRFSDRSQVRAFQELPTHKRQ